LRVRSLLHRATRKFLHLEPLPVYGREIAHRLSGTLPVSFDNLLQFFSRNVSRCLAIASPATLPIAPGRIANFARTAEKSFHVLPNRRGTPGMRAIHARFNARTSVGCRVSAGMIRHGNKRRHASRKSVFATIPNVRLRKPCLPIDSFCTSAGRLRQFEPGALTKIPFLRG